MPIKEIKKPCRNPICVFCGDIAEYDAPDNQGHWGYMCKDCFNNYTGSMAQYAGFHFEKEEK